MRALRLLAVAGLIFSICQFGTGISNAADTRSAAGTSPDRPDAATAGAARDYRPFYIAGAIGVLGSAGFFLFGAYRRRRATASATDQSAGDEGAAAENSVPVLGDNRSAAREFLPASENESHIHEIFDELPVAIWEEDWSSVRRIAAEHAKTKGEKVAAASKDGSKLFTKLIQARTIVRVNRGAFAIHGTLDKEQEIARQARVDRMPAGEVRCFRDLLSAFAKGRNSAQCDYTLEDPDTGDERRIRTTAVIPAHARRDWSRVLRIETDITAEYVAMKRILEREERFVQIAENLREVFWVSNADRSAIEYVSPAYETLWGRSPNEIYQNPKAFLDVVHPEDRQWVSELLDKQADGAYDINYRIVRSDGEVRWVRDRAAPITDEAGKVSRIVGVADDITEIRRKDRDLLHAQKIEALGQLVGGIAHDFNNVLTIILGNLQVLESRLRNRDNQKLLARVIEAAKREGRMVDELMLFSRDHELKQETCDINDVLTRMKELLSRTIGDAVQIQARLREKPCMINVDVSYFQTAIINLAINARDAMPNGGDLIIETDVVNLDAAFLARVPNATPGEFVMISVTDTGTGIPAAVLPHVFEPFFTTKEAGKGTGMGLAMVYGFVKESGGHISVQSEEGRGTTFKFYLPAAAAGSPVATVEANFTPAAANDEEPDDNDVPEGDDEPEDTEVAAPAASKGGNEVVLLVEDEELVRETAATLLESMGYAVVEAANGLEALEALRKNPNVDLLFTDTIMPGGLTGLELARRVQKLHPTIKVLITSGYQGDHLSKMRKYPRLRKPYSPADLASAIRRILDGEDHSEDGQRRHKMHEMRYR